MDIWSHRFVSPRSWNFELHGGDRAWGILQQKVNMSILQVVFIKQLGPFHIIPQVFWGNFLRMQLRQSGVVVVANLLQAWHQTMLKVGKDHQILNWSIHFDYEFEVMFYLCKLLSRFCCCLFGMCYFSSHSCHRGRGRSNSWWTLPVDE